MLQESIISFYSRCVIPDDNMLFAVPNGEKRDRVTAAKLVGISDAFRRKLSEEESTQPAGLGVVPGVHDLVLLLDRRRCALSVALIEIKVPEIRDHQGFIVTPGGTLSKQQRAVHKRVERIGHASFVVHSIDEFEALLRNLGVRLRTPQGTTRRPRRPEDDTFGAGWDTEP